MPETLAELRARAKRLGLRGYSKLRKDALQRLLATQHTRKSASQTGKKARARTAAKTTARRRPPAAAAASSQVKTGRRRPRATVTPPVLVTATGDGEQQIERAKYVMTRPGVQTPAAVRNGALVEDIDPLPAIRASSVCLLPQKPGVLHGYWSIPHYTRWPNPALRLRLARLRGEGFEVLEEFPLSADSGRWYFHLHPDTREDSLYLQLGFYRPDGEFITAMHRGLARLPSLYAAERADRRWWIDERRFRELYQRSGGFALAGRLGWNASQSSPGGHPSSHTLTRPRGDQS